MAGHASDLRLALRSLLRRPGFSAAVVLSLALAIGATAAIFSLVDAVLLGSLPVRDPDRVVTLYTIDEKNPGHLPISDENAWDIRRTAAEALDVAHFGFLEAEVGDDIEALPAPGLVVTSNYFDVLGVQMALGRGFDHDDRALGSAPEVVLSHDLWREHLGADPEVLGKRLIVNGAHLTVVGITPESFRGTGSFDVGVFLPYSMHREIAADAPFYGSRRWLAFYGVARMQAGWSPEQVDAELHRIGSQLEQAYPEENGGRTFAAVPLAHAVLGPDQRDAIVMASSAMMTIVVFILLIACANVANLLLARASGRRSEMAVRRVLGASVGRIVRQLLTESFVLAGLAGALGLALAVPLRDFIWSLRPPGFVLGGIRPEIDLRVVLFTAGVSVLTGLLFGLVPALRTARVDLVTPLKEETTPTTGGRSRFGLRALLVVFQVALSTVALVGAGLFIHSMANARRVDPGFDAEQLLLAAVDMQKVQGDAQALTVRRRDLVETAEALPEVEAASLAAQVPMGGGLFKRTTFVDGRDAEAEDGILIDTYPVGPGYFQAIGQPVLEGRGLAPADLKGKRRVVVINEAFARRYWPSGGAVGQQIRFKGEDEPLSIVGVAATVKSFTPMEAPTAALYVPLAQWPQPALTLVVRTRDPSAALPVVQQALAGRSTEITISDLRPMEKQIEAALFGPRAAALILGLFGVVALGLASIGIYGVMSYAVRQRTREIGIRMALGATPNDVLRFILLQSMSLVVLGVGFGIAGGLILQHQLMDLLFEVPMADPLAFGGALIVLIGTALLAGYVPARHATRIDPSQAMHHD